MYQENVVKKKHADLLLIGEEGNRSEVLIKDLIIILLCMTILYIVEKTFLLLLFISF